MRAFIIILVLFLIFPLTAYLQNPQQGRDFIHPEINNSLNNLQNLKDDCEARHKRACVLIYEYIPVGEEPWI
jgi:hypothetical protein